MDPRGYTVTIHLDSKTPPCGCEILLVIPVDIAYDLGNCASSLPVVALIDRHCAELCYCPGPIYGNVHVATVLQAGSDEGGLQKCHASPECD